VQRLIEPRPQLPTGVQPAPPTSWSDRPAHASQYLAERHESGSGKSTEIETFSDLADLLAVIRGLAWWPGVG
jgi:hypothetical protein